MSTPPHCGDGRTYHNEHFSIRYDTIDGTAKILELPLGLYEQCRQNKVDTVLYHSFAEPYGWRDYPFHTKARNALPELVQKSALNNASLNKPIVTAINPITDSWVRKWVESRLNTYTGRQGRKLCLICRNGYSSTTKNWGHRWREEMPVGKQREGEEARDFMRLMLRKDPSWIFLNFEDKIFEGDDTISDRTLNSFSYAEVFNSVGEGSAPYSLILRSLMSFADLCIGVPVGPYHLSAVYNNFPSIGLWVEHLPSWYDEPKEASINVVGSHTRDDKFFDRPGSFTSRDSLDFHVQQVDTRIITGEQVLAAVEKLLY